MKSGRCPKCAATPVVHLKWVPDRGDGEIEHEMLLFRKATVLQALMGKEEKYGLLQLYICQSCGFTEWYTADPRRLPVHEMEDAELVWADDAAEEREAYETLRDIHKR